MDSSSKFLLAAAIIAVLAVIQRKVNLKKKNRSNQQSLIIMSAVIAVAAAGSLLPSRDSFLDDSDLVQRFAGIDILVMNFFVLGAFLVVKIVWVFLVSRRLRKEKENGGGRGIKTVFYTFDEGYRQWFLKDRYINVREAFRWMADVAVGLCSVYLALTWTLGPSSFLWTYSFPAAGLLVLTEIYNFLNGYSREEFAHDVSGENAFAKRISNFYRMREVYEKLFPRELLTSFTQAECTEKERVTDYIQLLSNSEDRTEQITGTYFSLYEEKNDLDTDGINAALEMMNRRNVIFLNPFYRKIGRYLLLPMVDALMSDQKVLILAGRHSSAEDLRNWVEESIREYSRVRSLWRVAELSRVNTDCDVGILDFSHFYDLRTLEANRGFFSEAGLVIMHEPSLFLTTGQIGLKLISDAVEKKQRPVYCVIDRPSDGLVDILSHLLNTEFTNVVAQPAADSVCSAMAWKAEGDFLRNELFERETRYLGGGTELAAAAVKNQVPKVTWISDTKAPVRDIKWIDGQHFRVLSRYMNVPVQQQGIYKRIRFTSNLWQSTPEREQFVVVEDEFCNMFGAMRTYMGIGEEQTFVNVLSENYLMRDYMKENPEMFLANPLTVPSIMPDYAKTERNVLIRLLFLMAMEALPESEILREIRLAGRENGSVYDVLVEWIRRYTELDEHIFTIGEIRRSVRGRSFAEKTYEIGEKTYEKHFANSLKTAFYVVEDEQIGTRKIDARLYGHVTQRNLPGQYLTYDGKYYRVRSVSPENGVSLRRASDLYDGRIYYRQIRRYQIEKQDGSDVVSSYRKTGIEFSLLRRDITVETDGYLELKDNSDLHSARMVDFSSDQELVRTCRRIYRKKEILQVVFPEMDINVRFTLCVLMNELFRSVFPDSWPYITVTCLLPQELQKEENDLRYVLYSLSGDFDPQGIFFIEDSDVDLGLIGAVERNFRRFMEILADYLTWHLTERGMLTNAGKEEGEEKRDLYIRFTAVLREFAEKKEKNEEIAENGQPAEMIRRAGTDDGVREEGKSLSADCQEKSYLTFGEDFVNRVFRLKDLHSYFEQKGWTESAMKEARTRDIPEQTEMDFDASIYCDFCGRPLSGISYERLADGRIRCGDCSASAINTEEEFVHMFQNVLNIMESFYGIEYRTPVRVRMADAREVAKGVNMVFKPTDDFDGRVLGFAQKSGDQFRLVVENGSPRLAALDTMVHEMTHIWQYLNWDEGELRKYYPDENQRLIVYEGMAVWSAIQYLYLIGEKNFARQEELITERREDEYGIGFCAYREKYPLVRDSSLLKMTPFNHFPPL